MEKKVKVGLIRETKTPPDRRVPLTPSQVVELKEKYPNVEFYVQPSNIRCFTDDEYKELKIPMREDISDCDILMGVKEVEKETFIPGKTYLFFAHVAKKQEHNLEMLREILNRKVRIIDYEYLTKDNGLRVVAFGRWAGIVGAYNALRAEGMKTNSFNLKPAHQCHDLKEMWAGLKLIQLKPGLKILVTGEGRVSNGALETLINCNNLMKVSTQDFLSKEFDVPVVCQVGPQDYTKHHDGRLFDFNYFMKHPEEYRNDFLKFTKVTDILIAGHFWDPKSPIFFTKEDVEKPDFRISVIGDVSCDIDGPIPTTLRATTIADPFYDYNRKKHCEERAFSNPDNITVMSIDNLPGELPRDASGDFGRQLIDNVLHDLFTGHDSPMIQRATITSGGRIEPQYGHLTSWVWPEGEKS